MKKLIDINVEDYKSALEKITVNIKNFNLDSFSIIKCYKNYQEISTIECKKVNLIKIHKTIFLNLPSLIHLDLRDNKLLKISKNFKNFKNLKTLKLDDNFISFIPNFIGQFDKLDTFTICNNKISYVPTSIQYLQNLKIFKLSGNQITKLPIEFGLLKAIECLYIDCNYFTEIPTTFCYLKHLSEFSFEWLEFLNPPFSKVIKESIGRTIICLIRNSLQEMIKHNILYCDFQMFVERNSNTNSRRESTNKSNNNNNNNQVIDSQGTLPDRQAEENVITTTYNNTVEKEIPAQLAPLESNSTVQINGLHNKQSDSSSPMANIKLLKIFSAVENNYYGVIKAIIQTSDEYLKVKNSDNKNALHLAIQAGKPDIINLILSKTDMRILQMPHIYLHKVIRMRDPILVEKLVDLGIDINAPDDQGSTCFHILFSAFSKNLSKCALIADFLLKKGATLNNMNNDNWAPIHIAARRASKECLIWILQQNKILKRTGKEAFDLNATGKNKWTPLHLAVNSFRIEESLLLLNSGCDVFAKNSDGRTPRKVTNGNFLLAKLLRNFEVNLLKKKFGSSEKNTNNNINNHNCFTTVEDSSNFDVASSTGIKCQLSNNNIDICEKKSSDLVCFSEDPSKVTSPLDLTQKNSQVNLLGNDNPNQSKESGGKNNLTGKSQNFRSQLSSSLSKLSMENEMKGKRDTLANVEMLKAKKEEDSKSLMNTEKKSVNSKQNCKGLTNGNSMISSQEKKGKAPVQNFAKISLIANNQKNTQPQLLSISQFSTNLQNSQCLNMNSFKPTRLPGKVPNDISNASGSVQNNIISINASINMNNYLNTTKESQIALQCKEPLKVNLHFHKEVILSNESTFSEKYESLMYIKLSSSSSQNRSIELENVIKSIIEGLDLENEVNIVIFSDICNLIIVNQYFNLTPFLEVLQKTITTSTKKKYLNAFVEKEIMNTILILKAIRDSLKRTVVLNIDIQMPISQDHGVSMPSQNSIKKAKKRTRLLDQNPLNNSSQRVLSQGCTLEPLMMYNSNPAKHVRNIPKMKHFAKYFNTENASERNTEDAAQILRQVDEYNYEDMNEISKSYIDLKAYNDQVPHKKMQKDYLNGIDDSESCNIQDSSFSLARLDLPFTSKHSQYTFKSKGDNSARNDNKAEDDLFTMITPQESDPVILEQENFKQR